MIAEILFSTKLLDLRMKSTPLYPEAFDLMSVEFSRTVFVEYLMINKSIDFKNLTVRVLESWGFNRGNFVFGKITWF